MSDANCTCYDDGVMCVTPPDCPSHGLSHLRRGYRGRASREPAPLLRSERGEEGARSVLELAAPAQAFASLVALAERSSVLSVNLGQCSPDSGRGAGRFGVGAWCCTIEFNSGDLLDAVADSPYYRLGQAYRARFVTKGNQENV
jgi:hypothetical protein